MVDEPTPDTPSGDYEEMKDFWGMVEAILEGADEMREEGKKYLPKFPNETEPDYEYRRKNAKFTNIYRDIVENLVSKPFSKEVTIKDGTASSSVLALAEDIDGQGNHLHVFAGNLFFQGVNDAISWIFVDKPPVPAGASRAVEAQMGARPYWVHIPASRLLAVYSAVLGGKEEIIHARISEPETVRDGFAEREVKRVRVLDRPALEDGSYGPAVYEVWEEQEEANTKKKVWNRITDGPIAIGIIALVPFITGRRKEGAWQFVPPLQDAAYLQIEHYQQETGLKAVKELTCFPMLAGNGVSPGLDKEGNPVMVPVGPKSVLFAPANGEGDHGEWKFIEPSAESLKFLAEDVKATEQQMREIGRQPLTAMAGVTVVSAAYSSQKASTAVQAWALRLKDCLEQALKLTCLWLNDVSQPEVMVHTDFAIDMESDKAADVLLKMREAKDISREALIAEAKRRDWLSPEYDPDADMVLILDEVPGEPSEEDLQATQTDAVSPGA